VDAKNASSVLLASRNDLRWLMSHGESVPILQRYRHNINPLIRALSIWLLSRHASRFFLFGIQRSSDDDSPMVRKHVAKALRQLEARELLIAMATQNPDDRAITWFATFTANHNSFRDRLERFFHTTDDSNRSAAIGPSRMPLWFRDEYWDGAPAKSIAYMRMILRRIREMVHG